MGASRAHRAVLTSFLAAIALAAPMARAASPPPQVGVRRFALVVANNAGSGARPPLRFAEQDARRLARVLSELGGFEERDIMVLNGRQLIDVRAAMDLVRREVSLARARPPAKALLLFYFSGHSDGEALEIGKERLSFSELRRWVRDTAADVRIAVVDSCRSGALLAAKGGALTPRFDLRLENELASSGEVLITSSAADEVALESAELRASYFSHHLVSGLRGAADASGDGEVTLAEAYHHAFSRTVAATADTVIGPQHPVYDFKLAGQGDLVLTRLQRPTAVVEMPSGFDRLLVTTGTGNAMLEIGAGAARRVGLPAGNYQLHGWRGRELWTARLNVHQGEPVAVLEKSFVRAAQPAALAFKGGPADRGSTASLSAGASPSVTRGATPLASLRLDVKLARAPALVWSLSAGTVSGAAGGGGGGSVPAPALGFRESRFELGGAWAPSWAWPRFSASAGLWVGGGLWSQSFDGDPTSHWSGFARGGPIASVQWWAFDRVALQLQADVSAAVMKRDSDYSVVPTPSAWGGIVVGFGAKRE